MKKLDVICLTPKNHLILILCCWLLKKTLVITTNLTNPESAPDIANLLFERKMHCSNTHTVPRIEATDTGARMFQYKILNILYQNKLLLKF